MKLIGVGVGPGDPGLVTMNAARALAEADLVLIPVSAAGRESVAGNIVAEYFSQYGRMVDGGRKHLADAAQMIFPMTLDAAARDEKILAQIEALRPRWEKAVCVAMPVIGDSALYSTVAYLYDMWRTLVPDLELALVPGVSAHSLAASRAGEFLAMGEERFAVIPGNADMDAAIETLKSCDAATLYKLSAFGASLPEVVERSGPWGSAIRVRHAGLADEVITRGAAATEPTDDYLSVLMLRRAARQ